MDQPARRHSRWWEVILFSDLFHLAAGLIATVLLPATVLWGSWWQWLPEWGLPHPANWNALVTASVCFLVSARILSKMKRYSAGGGALANILPVVAIVFLLAFMLLLFLRSDYARALLLISFTLTLLWSYAGYFLGRNYQRRKYAVLPAARKFGLQESERIELRYLDKPDLEGVRYDAIVADLRSAETSGDWERFLAECILAHIPVFHAQQVVEALTGRVHIDHLSENAAGALTPSPLYAAIKHVIDAVGALILIPITSPIMAIAAVAIRLDSVGPAVFKQERVGLGNKDFTVYKFRSMRIDSEADSRRNTTNGDDDRITRVGHFIRKTRIDELPQLWNVLKGDMSFIGPRPEWRALATQYETLVPFYSYRHVVRPGITGWAQVTQGYAWDADATKIKIQYDFYYIKHFSFWLDLLIVLKTLRVIFTGWGAR